MDNQLPQQTDELDIKITLKPEAFLKTFWIYFNTNSKRWQAKNCRHADCAGAENQFEVIPLEDARERIMALVKENAELKQALQNVDRALGEAIS